MWSNTDCRTVSELLWNYTSHRLPEQEIDLVERHLTGCGACRAEADAYRQAVDGLAAIRRTSMPESRRGWRDLEARLMQAPPRRSVFQSLWAGVPRLTWGGIGAAAIIGILCLPHMRDVNHAANTGSSQPMSARIRPPAGPPSEIAQAVIDNDSADWETALEAMALSRSARAPRRSPIEAMPKTYRAPIQWASASPAPEHSRVSLARGGRRRVRNMDFRHLDGRGRQSNNADGNDYVLTPVSATSESDSGAQYVMGSLVMSARSDDTEVARGW